MVTSCLTINVIDLGLKFLFRHLGTLFGLHFDI